LVDDDAVCRIVADQVGMTVEQVSAADDLWAVGLTSLAAVRILMDIEDEFGVTFPDDSLTRDTFASVPALGAVLREALGADTATRS